jgi:hypothetical protein
MKKIKLENGDIVEMREPKVKDMKLVANIENDFDREVALIVNLTGKTPDEVDDLSMKDFNKIDEELKSFLS